jgi:hypothetical protein
LAACDGGKGGQGGNGGPGGGGLGGHAIAIAFTGTAVTKAGTTTLMPGTAGTGGPGGNSDAQMNSGANGVAEEEREFL